MSVLITGGGSGIGEGAAKHFASNGARVTITGRREDRLRQVVENIGPNATYVAGDVTKSDDRIRMVQGALENGEGLDVLISNAGNIYRCDVEDYDEEQLLNLFHSNVVGGMMLLKESIEHLKQAKGCVLFVGSVHTQRAFPNASPYAATKGALETLTGVLAAELGKYDVRVGCVRPGGVLTEINVRAGLSTADEARERLEGMGNMHALGRIGTVSEVAEAFEYLATAEWATGNVLTIDGGLGLGVTQE
ncbi:MAG: short-chain dehydrogenase [Acidimicrobiaceae bacterium]|nr:short-chain dehydrogenase [Acidimicrobiaceae bacterium]